MSAHYVAVLGLLAGCHSATLTRRDGTTVEGVVLRSTDDTVFIEGSDGTEVAIARADIERFEPPGGGALGTGVYLIANGAVLVLASLAFRASDDVVLRSNWVRLAVGTAGALSAVGGGFLIDHGLDAEVDARRRFQRDCSLAEGPPGVSFAFVW